MTQPETAVGGEAVGPDSLSPHNDPIDDLVEDFLGPDAPEDEEEDAGPDDVRDDAGDHDDAAYGMEDEPDQPAIAPPVSWTAEEKAFFKTLPPEAQQTLARREAERDRFVQAKAQEAAHARSHVEREALSHVQRISEQYAQQLRHALPQVPQKPNPMLQVDDPYAYAEQMEAHEAALAQHYHVQQQLHHAQAQAQQAEQVIRTHEVLEGQALLSQEFPEYLDPEQMPKLREQLRSIGHFLGYSDEQLSQTGANDILAMRRIANLKDKADKYDQLMGRKMETVRAAKALPKVARPGAASTGAHQSASRREADWERVKATKDPAAFARFLGL